jgi:putative redox protein
MEILVRYKDGVRFEASARGHVVECDQPVQNGGSDSGMTPPEFLLAALGTFAGYYAAEYLRTRGLPVAGLQVRISAEKTLKPARLETFLIDVESSVANERHRLGIERAVNACLVHAADAGLPQAA